MIQKIVDNLPVLVALITIILTLYLCAFKRIWRERKDKTTTVREELLSPEEHDLSHRGT